MPFYDTAKIVLHLIPVISFSPAQSYDIDKIYSQPTRMLPIHSDGGAKRYNLDGFLTYSKDQQVGKSYSYVQLYRNGIVEAVNGSMFRLREGELKIYAEFYEPKLVESFKIYLSIMNELTVEPPIFVFLTLLGVKGYSMAVSSERFSIDEIHTIDRDVLVLPEILIRS